MPVTFQTKFAIVVKNQNVGRKSKLWPKIEISVENRNYGQAIEILVENRNYGQEIEILVENLNYGQEIKILVENLNYGQKIKILLKIRHCGQKSKVWSKFTIVVKNRFFCQKFNQLDLLYKLKNSNPVSIKNGALNNIFYDKKL